MVSIVSYSRPYLKLLPPPSVLVSTELVSGRGLEICTGSLCGPEESVSTTSFFGHADSVSTADFVLAEPAWEDFVVADTVVVVVVVEEAASAVVRRLEVHLSVAEDPMSPTALEAELLFSTGLGLSGPGAEQVEAEAEAARSRCPSSR